MDSSLAEDIRSLACELGVESDSFLHHPTNTDDPDYAEQIIDGLTLALVTFCYHKHPRGENVYELMDQMDLVDENSEEAQHLQMRAEEAAALQIPFIVNLNRMLEDYYQIRKKLEEMSPQK